MIRQESRTEDHPQDANRHIDKENSPPKLDIHQPATQDGAKRRSYHQGNAEDAQGRTLLSDWKSPVKLRRAERLCQPTAETLQGAGGNQQTQRGRDAA